MPNKVIIIGAKGMLGQDLIKTYEADKFNKVYAWDFADIDITDEKLVNKKIKEIDPDVVINAAAYNAVDKAEEVEGFKVAMAVNSEGPKHLAATCKNIGAVFATYSSDYVFRGDKKEGYREEDKPDPVSKYGQSKHAGEKNVQKAGGKYFIIRTSKLFGKEGTGKDVKKSFVDTMIELSARLPELKVVDEEVSCFTYTPDLAKATRFLLEGNYPAGIYHLTNAEPCTWYQCAKSIFEILGKNIKLMPVPASTFPRPAKRPDYSVLLNTKLPPLRSYEDALKDFLKKN
ncbi:MAG: dTDP-4-dehydrorhamnose reductase [Candidatus Moraniibacteriota bacterium]